MNNNQGKEEKILPEELQYLDSLRKENTIHVLKSENLKLQYENTLFKIMRKYNLTEKDSIDENSGLIIRNRALTPEEKAADDMQAKLADKLADKVNDKVKDKFKEKLESKKEDK